MASAPPIESNWAPFLDLDGTLIDIAPAPDRVVVPDGLIGTLSELRGVLDGALAIVSGRSFHEIDHLLSPVQLSGGAEHGAFIREASGATRRDENLHAIPTAWRRELMSATRRWSGVQVEEKTQSVAVHYRQAPEWEDDVKRLAATIVERDPTHFEILPAKMAVEIRARGASKGAVVDALMRSPPFAGRVPVFVGDDVTDEAGIVAARALGGHGLHVADAFDGQPSHVRAWLAQGAAALRAN